MERPRLIDAADEQAWEKRKQPRVDKLPGEFCNQAKAGMLAKGKKKP